LRYALTGIVGVIARQDLAQRGLDRRPSDSEQSEEGGHRNGKLFSTLEIYFNIFNAVKSDTQLMAVPESIQPLVERYTYHREACLRGQEKFNESQLRQDFTDPLHKMLRDVSLDHDKELLTRWVEATDASIDKLVYELYGLTEEDVKFIDGTGK